MPITRNKAHGTGNKSVHASAVLITSLPQLLDVKVYLAHSKQPYATIAKTQVPVLDIPCSSVKPANDTLATLSPTTSFSQACSVQADDTSGQTMATSYCATASVGSKMHGSPFAAPVHAATDPDSAPGTPRGRLVSTAGAHW